METNSKSTVNHTVRSLIEKHEVANDFAWEVEDEDDLPDEDVDQEAITQRWVPPNPER